MPSGHAADGAEMRRFYDARCEADVRDPHQCVTHGGYIVNCANALREELKNRSAAAAGVSFVAMQDDMTTLMRTLRISTHARDASPHEVMVSEIIPKAEAIASKLERVSNWIGEMARITCESHHRSECCDNPERLIPCVHAVAKKYIRLISDSEALAAIDAPAPDSNAKTMAKESGHFGRIKCSAFHKNGCIYEGPEFATHDGGAGADHWSITQKFPASELLKGGESGFVTYGGFFVDRHEGARIALASGQIKRLHFQPDTLFSEDFNHPDDAPAPEPLVLTSDRTPPMSLDRAISELRPDPPSSVPNGQDDNERLLQEECDHCGDPKRRDLSVDDLQHTADGDALCGKCGGDRCAWDQAIYDHANPHLVPNEQAGGEASGHADCRLCGGYGEVQQFSAGPEGNGDGPMERVPCPYLDPHADCRERARRLREYAAHKGDCQVLNPDCIRRDFTGCSREAHPNCYECTCGLAALLAEGTIAELRGQVSEQTAAWEFLAVQFEDMKAWKDRESTNLRAVVSFANDALRIFDDYADTGISVAALRSILSPHGTAENLRAALAKVRGE